MQGPPSIIPADPEDLPALVSFVVSLNVKRRNLSKSQISSIAWGAKQFLAREAKKRQATSSPGTYGGKPLRVNSPEAVEQGRARDKAADLVGVSGKLVDMAKKVEKQGVQELYDAVQAGEVSVSAAAQVSELPEEKQKEIVEQGPKKMHAPSFCSRPDCRLELYNVVA